MFEKLLIGERRNVIEALHQLEKTRRKILYVTNENFHLIGTLTDGDVRRWILGGGDMDGEVGIVCNRTPYSVEAGYRVDDIKNVMAMKNITSMPVLNDEKCIIDVLFWENLFGIDKDSQDKTFLKLPVVVMAGGMGTRLAPFTRVLPKPLIPLGEKTAIEVIIDSFVEHGVEDFYLSVNYKSKLIQAFFEELTPSYRLSYIYEEKPLGTGGGLHALAGKLDGDLIVTNCDVIIKADYHDMVEHHLNESNEITMVVSLRHYDIPYGICDIVDNGQLCAMREKPQYNFLVNTGMYVIKSSVLDMIPVNQFYNFTDLINDVKNRGGRVGVYPISDKAWLDTGEWQQYCDTMAQLRS
ncbi:MAG: sugar phosphate nucleotidyltransferase [Pseudomonadota bacterium]